MDNLNDLIRRWQNGDEQAAQAIYNQHRAAIFRLAYSLLGNAADAKEITQDVLTYALMHIQRYDPQRSSFTTWLHMIAVSRCRDRQRRRWLPRISLTDWLRQGQNVADPQPTPERKAIALETHTEVWQAVQSLSPRLREAVLLRYWAGHTYQEMAIILKCPLSTVQSRVYSACQKLQPLLAAVELSDLSLEAE